MFFSPSLSLSLRVCVFYFIHLFIVFFWLRYKFAVFIMIVACAFFYSFLVDFLLSVRFVRSSAYMSKTSNYIVSDVIFFFLLLLFCETNFFYWICSSAICKRVHTIVGRGCLNCINLIFGQRNQSIMAVIISLHMHTHTFTKSNDLVVVFFSYGSDYVLWSGKNAPSKRKEWNKFCSEKYTVKRKPHRQRSTSLFIGVCSVLSVYDTSS